MPDLEPRLPAWNRIHQVCRRRYFAATRVLLSKRRPQIPHEFDLGCLGLETHFALFAGTHCFWTVSTRVLQKLQVAETKPIPEKENWLRGRDLNPRPSGYEPDELPGCSTPRLEP